VNTEVEPTAESIKLNLGCGSVQVDGWENLDCSWNLLTQRVAFFGPWLARRTGRVQYQSNQARYMNLTKRWHYADASVEVVYSCHVFEHLHRSAAQNYLRESRRVLKNNGALRIVVPDLHEAAKLYLEQSAQKKHEAADDFLGLLNLHLEHAYPKRRGVYAWLSRWQDYPHQHKYMYDERSLANLLAESGFQNIRSSTFGESAYINDIRAIENAGERAGSLYLEARLAAQ
jgi:ubiquinone/menaquinone biosynthesis C-methylase UbiE